MNEKKLKRNKLLLSIVTLHIALVTIIFAQVDTAWVRRYNGPGNGYDGTNAVAVDGSGNVYVTGYSEGSGTVYDYATIKYNSDGVEQWVTRYNGPGNGSDEANAIAIDGEGNVYITGGGRGSGTYWNWDYATIKYNPSGETLWVRRYNDPGHGDDCAYAIAVDSSGNVYVTGRSTGSGTGLDYATIKYNSDGVEQWVTRYNGPGNGDDFAWELAIDNSGNVYVSGRSPGLGTGSDYATIKYDSNGVEQWVARYNGPGNLDDWVNAIAIDGSGNVYVTGGSRGSGTGNDYVTIKYDSNGVEQWLERYNGPGNGDDWAFAMAVDSSNNVYVTGRSWATETQWDYATIKYNSSGNTVWVRRYNGPGNGQDEAYALAIDGSGNVYVTGYSYSGISYDYATIKYDSNGIQQWFIRYNGPGNDWDGAQAIAIDGSGNVYVTGGSRGVGTADDYATIKYAQGAGIEERLTPNAIHTALGIYPNPARSYFVVRLPQTADRLMLNASRPTLKIYDVSGKLIKEERVKEKKEISLKGIEPGVYFLKVGDNMSKLIVLK